MDFLIHMDCFLQCVIIRTDIFKMSVLHPEACRNRSKLYKAQALIQMPGMHVGFHHSIKLQYAKFMPLRLFHTVQNQLLSDMSTPHRTVDSIAGIANMAAAANIVWMQNVKPRHTACRLCHTAIGLGSKKQLSALYIQEFLLREGNPIFHNLIPDFYHGRKVLLRIRSYANFHITRLFFLYSFIIISVLKKYATIM